MQQDISSQLSVIQPNVPLPNIPQQNVPQRNPQQNVPQRNPQLKMPMPMQMQIKQKMIPTVKKAELPFSGSNIITGLPKTSITNNSQQHGGGGGNHIAVLIITRFSLKLGMRTRNLHNISRLKKRLNLFKRITLPSVLGQTYSNFKWIIMYDKYLPLEILEELREIISPYMNNVGKGRIADDKKFIYLEKYSCDNEDNTECFKNLKMFMKYIDIGHNYALTVRLDDDDAIARNLIERHHSIATKKLADFLVITNPNGLYMMIGNNAITNIDTHGIYMKKSYPFIALGLSLLVNIKKNPITIYYNDHSTMKKELDESMIAYNNSKYSYIRILHSENDSGLYKHIQMQNDFNDIKYIKRHFSLKGCDLKNINKFNRE